MGWYQQMIETSGSEQKRRGSTKYMFLIRHGPSSSLYFLAVLNSTVIGSFVCLPYLQESLLETTGSLTTYLHKYIQSRFWRPDFCKRKTVGITKTVGIRNRCLCAEAIHTCSLTSTYLFFFGAQPITLDWPSIHKKKVVETKNRCLWA